MDSICLVRLSALGDVLMFVPTIRTLQKNFPKAKLTWVISPFAYQIVKNLDGVEFIVVDMSLHLKGLWSLYKAMRHRRFDVLLGAQASVRANILYPLIPAKRKIGYDDKRAKDFHRMFVREQIAAADGHTLDGFLQFAQHIGANNLDIRWDIPISDADNTRAKALLGDVASYAVINPVASKPERSWTLDGYLAVIAHLQSQHGLRVVLTGGPVENDRAMAKAILERNPDCVDLVGKTKPKELLAIIRDAKMVLCPDTGPSHMAAAVGTPTIALHAVTSSRVSGPYHAREWAVDYYDTAVREILKQEPSQTKWGKHIHGEETMKLVPVEKVIARCDALLTGG